MEPVRCSDCNVEEGQYHEDGCLEELCPFCYSTGHAACECSYRVLEIRYKEAGGLPSGAYENGLPPHLEEEWERIKEFQGRIRFVSKPLMCDRCGVLRPDMFKIADETWEKYIGDPRRHLCINCFRVIKRLVEKHTGSPPEDVKVRWWPVHLGMELDLSDVPEPYLETSQGGGWSFCADQLERQASRKK